VLHNKGTKNLLELKSVFWNKRKFCRFAGMPPVAAQQAWQAKAKKYFYTENG